MSSYSLILYFALGSLFFSSCKEQEKIEVPIPVAEKKDSLINITLPKKIAEPLHTDTLSFVEYNDDGDYFYLYAENDKELFGFINDKNEDRSYLRGDIIEVNWKKDSIYIAGDNEAAYIADWVVSTKNQLHEQQPHFGCYIKNDARSFC